jgi:methyl-accepting chemotaxis protein
MSGFLSPSNAGTGTDPSGESDSPAAHAAGPTHIEAELRTLRAQATQARTILGDAIGKLGNSFETIQADTAGQRATMEMLLRSLASKSGDVGPSGEGGISIQEFIFETSSVLRQFTDLLSTVSGESMKTVYRIDDMAAQLEDVFKLVASINEISQETFILAVNATIEAAHAGQAGRTFAVIASNVRDLSQRTKRFNNEIGLQIGKAQATINEVREIVAEMASRDLNVALTGKERVQSMLPQLERFREAVSHGVDHASDAGARIAASTSTAVTALQFEDIVTQLIGSMVKRAERMAALASPLDADGVSAGSTLPLPVRNEEVIASDPVHQTDMNPGDVELF